MRAGYTPGTGKVKRPKVFGSTIGPTAQALLCHITARLMEVQPTNFLRTTQYLLGRDEEIYSNPSVLLATCMKMLQPRNHTPSAHMAR